MKSEISQENLTATIEAMNDYQKRLEADAAALASLPGMIPRRIAERRAEEAETVKGLLDFFSKL